jgi:hypothetical protein
VDVRIRIAQGVSLLDKNLYKIKPEKLVLDVLLVEKYREK